jgi:DNA-binding transcriptional LysR family regulator
VRLGDLARGLRLCVEMDRNKHRQVNRMDDARFPRIVDWNLFFVFHEIIRTGGVSAAARSLNRQQPSVSASLKRLEEQFGTALCERSAQGVQPTEAGRALYQLCETMLSQVRRMPHDVALAAGRDRPPVRLLMISDLVSPELDQATATFHRNRPGAAVRLEVAPWRAVVAALEKGEADIGVTCDGAASPSLAYTPLTREIQQLYCGSGHPLFGTSPREPYDYAGEGFVLTGDDEPEELLAYRRAHGLGSPVLAIAETLYETRRLLELGIGVGFLPTAVAERSAAEGKLWPLLPRRCLLSYDVHVAVRRGKVSADAQALLGLIQSALSPARA